MPRDDASQQTYEVKPTLDGGLDEIRCEKGERDRHVDLPDGAFVARSDGEFTVLGARSSGRGRSGTSFVEAGSVRSIGGTSSYGAMLPALVSWKHSKDRRARRRKPGRTPWLNENR